MSTPESAVELATRRGIAWRKTDGQTREAGWRLVFAGPLIAVATTVAALIATGAADVTFRDPDHIAVLYVLEVWAGVALLVGLDIFLRARKLTGTRWPSRAAMGAVRRERWTPFRIGAVALAIVAFYASYLAYRNLKSVVPLLRPEDLFDAQLADIDRVMFLGNDPATLLHSLFGTGISAHVISALYIAFIVFLPLSLGVALVFAERLKASLFYAAALGLNWIIGAATYLLVPALGPIYFYPQWFSDLPHTETTRLQDLLDVRPRRVPRRPGDRHAPGDRRLRLAPHRDELHGPGRRLPLRSRTAPEAGLWIWLGITTIATVYLGWHYFIDDVAGVAVAIAALFLARVITGYDPRTEHSEQRGAAEPAPAGAAS